jgi:hypothetical protein
MPSSSPLFMRKRRDDLRGYLASMQPSHMMTVNYSVPLSGGRETRHRALAAHLRRWNREVLEGMYGRKFWKRNQENEFFFAAFIETGVLYQKDHLHAVVRVPDPNREWFEKNAAVLWKPTADVVVQRINDAAGAVSYCSKGMAQHPDWLVLSTEFKRAPEV